MTRTSSTSLDVHIPVSGTLRMSHSGMRWVVVGLVAWIVLSLPIGILIGKMVKRATRDYPFEDEDDEESHSDLCGRCVEVARTKVR